MDTAEVQQLQKVARSAEGGVPVSYRAGNESVDPDGKTAIIETGCGALLCDHLCGTRPNEAEVAGHIIGEDVEFDEDDGRSSGRNPARGRTGAGDNRL